jgi:thiol-disulfide isomerase/thioredoxin
VLSFKGLLAVLVTGFLLAIPLYFYWGFLTRGMSPSAGTLRLNQMEKEGFPDFTLPDLTGKSVSLSGFKDQPVLVNLWASWCAPCVKEFPALMRLVQHFKGKLVVLAVSHDRSREDLDSFIKTFGAVPQDFVIVWDKERTTGDLLGTGQLPETFILNREHKVVRKITGDQPWDEPMALEYFSHALGI